jgi:hypothetical protein
MNEQANLKTIMLMEDYSDRVTHGDEDSDEALQNAVDWVFRDRCDTFRANLYADIKERWDNRTYILRFIDAYKAIEDTLSE